jgi:hypothetical protein
MKTALLAVGLLLGAALGAQPDYTAYTALLRACVDANGRVDYAALHTRRTELAAVTRHFSQQNPGPSWSRNAQLAFWINAYNAFTLQCVADNYPVKSIRDLDGGNPWDVQRIPIGGKTYALNQIEHDIVRPTFNDPRIHFALNCAARSCPPLLNEAFTPERLDRQLTERTRRFVRSDANRITPDAAAVSKIFEWYRTDFGDLIAFLNAYAATTVKPNARITFQPYDWSLNGR